MSARKFARWLLPIGGAVVALAAGGGVGWLLMSSHRGEPSASPPASQGGLVIGSPTSAAVAPSKILRCFVGGRFVGDFTLAECAKRNGVASDALDVGVDQTGALAAAQQGGAALIPLPPPEPQTQPPPIAEPSAERDATGACWRYGEGGWRKLPSDMTLNACVQTLFGGRCEGPGGASYGRWAQQTLRLVAGRVEISSDNRNFRGLAEQGPNCTLPSVG